MSTLAGVRRFCGEFEGQGKHSPLYKSRVRIILAAATEGCGNVFFSLTTLTDKVLSSDDNLYNEAIRVGDDPELAAALVRKLPDLHLTVLSFLIKFLQLFVRPEVVNITKMDASNLSMVFAPNFLRCSSTDPIVIMENTRKEMAFVKTLIHHLDTEAVEGVS